MTKEEKWLFSRIGRPTSSKIKVLKTGGRRDMRISELVDARLLGYKRTTVDVEFGETAISYLYQLKRELRLGKPHFNASNRNFDFGHQQEPYAIDWLKANHPELGVLHCSGNDFDEIVFKIAECGLGDSPDFYTKDGDVGEIKCPISEEKFEQLMDMTAQEVRKEYEDQFAGHFIANPDAKRLYYLIYDGMRDEDPFDTLDPLDPSRGLLFVYERSEFDDLINEIIPKITKVVNYLKTNKKIRDINEHTDVQ